MLLRLSSLGQNQDVEVHIINTGKGFPSPLCPSVTDLWNWAENYSCSREHPWKTSLGQTCFLSPCSRSHQVLLRHDTSSVHDHRGLSWWTCSQGCRMSLLIGADKSRMQNAKSRVMWRKVSRNYFSTIKGKGKKMPCIKYHIIVLHNSEWMLVPGMESSIEIQSKIGQVFTWAKRNPVLWKGQVPLEMRPNNTLCDGGQVTSPSPPSVQTRWELSIAFPNTWPTSRLQISKRTKRGQKWRPWWVTPHIQGAFECNGTIICFHKHTNDLFTLFRTKKFFVPPLPEPSTSLEHSCLVSWNVINIPSNREP